MRVIFTLVLVALWFNSVAQRYAVADGNWEDAIWATTDNGIPGSAATPTASDNVYTNGFSVTVNSDVECNNLYVRRNVSNGLVIEEFSFATVTIYGFLTGTNNSGSTNQPPQVADALTMGEFETIRLVGSGVKIGAWLYTCPLTNVVVSPGVSQTATFSTGIRLENSGVLTIENGTLSIISPNATRQIRGCSSCSLVVNSGATFSTPAAINGGGTATSDEPSTLIGFVTINGTITTSNYINAESFSMGSGGLLQTTYSGVRQTEGWWYQSNRPTGGTIDAGSTINYRGANQNVYARDYGNLTLSGSGTKTVPNAAALNINGSLTVSAVTLSTIAATGVNIGGNLINDGTWSPVQLITFNGSTASSVGGSQSTPFGGGLRVNKTSGNTLSLNTGPTISNGITLSSGNLNLGEVTTTLISGNVATSSGTSLTSGLGGSLFIQSTSQFSGAGSFTLNNVTVESTGVATFNNNISFTGNLTNNGTLTFPTSVDVTFSGGNAQTISGNAFSIYDMIVNKTSSTLSNNAPLTLQGNLTMTTGTFDADGTSGQFILSSDTNGDASIGPMAGGSITGNVTFQRYFNNTVVNRYRNFAFPVTGVTVSNVGSFITIVNGSFARYNESALGNYDQGWVILTSGTLSSNTAYTAGMYTAAPITFSFTGPLFKNLPTTSTSPHVYNVTYTDDPAQPASQDGWNFVPNPYACPISWNAASGWTKGAGIDAAAAIWDAVAGAYRYSNTTWDGVVAQGQSFWVHTSSAATTLQSTENVKVINSDPTFYRKRQEIIPNDRLMVKLEDDKNNYDVALIQFNEAATAEYDGAFDAFKLKNAIFNVSTLTPKGENLAINVMPKSACTSNIKLNVNNIEQGTYRLVFDSLITFPELKKMTLVDHFANEEIELTEGTSYGFSVTTDSDSWGSERFELRFSFADVYGYEPVVSMDGQILVSSFETGNQWLLNGEPLAGENNQTLLPTTEGDYQVSVSEGECFFESNILTVKEIPHRIYPNPATESFTIDLNGILEGSAVKTGYIYLYSLNGQLVYKEKFSNDVKDKLVRIGNLKAGEYIVNVTIGDTKTVAKERLMIK